MIVAPPPSPPAIVRAWSAALNRNDNASAALLFAPNARIIQGPLDVRLTSPQLALAFNSSLPCAGRITRITVKGDRATATFVLGKRPKHTCNATKGEKAAALFVVRDGKIVLWQEVPVPTGGGGPPA
jgi:SnoaL-like protein